MLHEESHKYDRQQHLKKKKKEEERLQLLDHTETEKDWVES